MEFQAITCRMVQLWQHDDDSEEEQKLCDTKVLLR